MGSIFSSLFTAGAPAGGLGDLPEDCVALVLARMDPPEICRLAGVSRVFHRASCADSIWESKLPENYNRNGGFGFEKSLSSKKDLYGRLSGGVGVGVESGRVEVWIEKRKGGFCMAVSWRGMKIIGIHDRRYWTQIPTLQSRFHTIAYLQQIWWLQVEGDVEFEFPTGNYSLFFRLRLGKPSTEQKYRCSSYTRQVHGWDIKPVHFQFSVSNGQHVISECFLNKQGKWLCYHVGDFVVEDSYKPTKIKFSMTQIDCTHQKGGLSLDSVFILPSESGAHDVF